MPIFSIIVPVYNVAPWLRECLDSIAMQTLRDWECVCVDDGSTDESGVILDEYAAKDPRFKVIHQANTGVSSARNRALDCISGRYFTFVDGDDAIVPDSLECFAGVFRETGTDGILCAPYDDFLSISEWKTAPNGITILVKDIKPPALLTSPYAPNGYTVSRAYRHSTFESIRFPPDIETAEDTRYQFDCLALPAHWCVVRKKYYAYRRGRPGSASRSVSPQFCLDYLGALLHSVQTMRVRMGASTRDISVFVAKYGEIYTRSALHPAFRRWKNWSREQGNELFLNLESCHVLSGFWPFRWTDQVRLTVWKLGLDRLFFPLLLLLDRARYAIKRRWAGFFSSLTTTEMASLEMTPITEIKEFQRIELDILKDVHAFCESRGRIINEKESVLPKSSSTSIVTG